ncbi:MAG: hypothetical protein H6657_00280 [Ardenticatenaceae bacterium]|nr:hypothetical protein [Ardenticatenaceae bacterium]
MAQQPVKQLIGLFIFLLLLGAAACTPPTVEQIPVRETPTVEPTAVPVAAHIEADCFQSATALAWLDENGDGVQDEGEPPLPGIEFVLEPTVYSRTLSDENGIAAISATTPGLDCPEPLTIAVSRHDGYTVTTASAVPVISISQIYAFGFQPLPMATLIETETYQGALFTAVSTAEFINWLDEPADDFWTPTEADVASFEAGLAQFLQENSEGQWDTLPIIERLPEYTRQYFGFVQNEEQLIFANMFCDAMSSDWLEAPVVVADGGNCYLQIIFNADANTYLSLYVNGES